MKTDELFQTITDRIVAQMEAGARPWCKPWDASKAGFAPSLPHNIAGRSYRGGNAFWLMLLQDAKGYPTPTWCTFKQALDAGGNVRKGEKGTAVFYWHFEKRENATTGKVDKIVWAKSYTVFNIAQCDGVAAPVVRELTRAEQLESAEETIRNTGAVIRHGGDIACYVPSMDFVRLPVREAFKETDGYYSTAFHELGHWTGAKHRLAREFGKRFGDDAYAFEELVAELTAAFVTGALGMANPARDDHAAYLASWIKVLKGDKGAFITAAGKAQAAADFILQAQAEEQAEAA